MNKKFSTLLAGVLLAGSVGASAQFSPSAFTTNESEIRQAKYYALGVDGASDVVAVDEAATCVKKGRCKFTGLFS